MKKYRNKGAIGALLDEYERANLELIHLIADISSEELMTIVDTTTKDPDCRSIQSILTHVVESGYWYVIEIRNYLQEEIIVLDRVVYDNIKDYQTELVKMFQYNEKLFKDHPRIKLEELENDKKMIVRWGQTFDVEQLMEHAIVHILRHRRQIERFLLKLRPTPVN